MGVRVEKEKAIESQDFELAASKRDEEKKLNAERAKLEKQFRAGNVRAQGVVDEGLIAEVLAQATGILGFKTVTERSENELYLFAAIDDARFKKPVLPGDTMILEVKFLKERRNMWKFYGEAKVEGQIVCSAELMCARREL